MTNWISVKDRLPDIYATVLILQPDKVVEVANLPNDYILHPDSGNPLFRKGFPRGLYEATHWMPLPEPPTDGA